MVTFSRSAPEVPLDSPYAAELRGGFPKLRFGRQLEPEYVRARLSEHRTLICVTCVLAALVAVARGVEHAFVGQWSTELAASFTVVIGGSIALAWVACSAAFHRWYLPLALTVVPLRSAIVAMQIAKAAAHGQLEMLMILPLMVIGPFFFLGLQFRAALFPTVLAVATFLASAIYFELALPVALRSGTLVLMALVACAIAARYSERWSRKSFLESRVIAELAQLDAVTGTKNRRVFDEYLARLWQQAVEDRRSIAILLVDIDHFKAYNDRYGHQAGDQTLRRVAQTLQAFVRRPLDVLARYGGEEFAGILYDIEGRQAKEIADRMRQAVRELAIEHRGSRTCPVVTVSIGVAVMEPTRERKPRGALQLADQALYEAKVKGRNRVELMDEAEYRMLETGVFSKESLRVGNG